MIICMDRKIKIRDNLSWKELKVLNDLYCHGKTQASTAKSDYLKYLINDVQIIDSKVGSSKILVTTDAFYDFYEYSFKDSFNYYNEFLHSSGLPTDAKRNLNENDIKSLMLIDKNKVQIRSNLTTVRTFSKRFFEGNGSKYVENKKSVKGAVCTILDIIEFPEFAPKENLWRFVTDCPYPIAVVLCENLNFLKTPWIAEKHNIKLWYVGGNNIGIVDKIDQAEFKYPFYYSGDWDCAGLEIYSRIKRKLKDHHKEITLLTPDDLTARLPTNCPHHKSRWKFDKELSGLTISDFNADEQKLIIELIEMDEWLEEESNDLIKMLNSFL
jgi:hypothetical protein